MKTSSLLRFSHFGNHLDFHCDDPDLALEILKYLKTPRTKRQLQNYLKKWDPKKVLADLRQLENSKYVIFFDSKTQRTKVRDNPILAKLVKSPEIRSLISSRIATTAIGLIDLAGVSSDFKKILSTVGFTEIKTSNKKNGEVSNSFIRDLDFFIVIAAANQRIFVSKLNQQLFAQKKKWLFVSIDAFGGRIGPTFGVAGGPCYECIIESGGKAYDHGFNEFENIDLLVEKDVVIQNREDEFLIKSLFPHIATEAVKVASGVMFPQTYDGFYSLDLFNLRMDYLPLGPSPTCLVCSQLNS